MSAPNPGFARPPDGVQENLGAVRRGDRQHLVLESRHGESKPRDRTHLAGEELAAVCGQHHAGHRFVTPSGRMAAEMERSW